MVRRAVPASFVPTRPVLGQRITTRTLGGMALILIGVFGVFRKRFGPGRRAP
jgi:drug/metabolite transporter (DMT)-like permease